jgi:archaellum biogenesis ATPase FlaH
MILDEISLTTIPHTLRSRPHWVLWKNIVRNGQPTKVPFKVNGDPAESNNPQTWSAFDPVSMKWRLYDSGYEGPGFMFAEDDNLCGIDLDGCRDPETGEVAAWAKEIILMFDTYAEVSPSKTGVKLFVVGRSPFDSGKNLKLSGVESMGGKSAGIEVYDHGRYFAVTGWRLNGPEEPQDRQEQLNALKAKFWPETPRKPPAPKPSFYSESSVMERAAKYLTKVPIAVSGDKGHDKTFYAACILVRGFGLPAESALSLLETWNLGCQPPWSERELRHKIQDASKANGPINYLRDARPEQWATITPPMPESPPPRIEPKVITIAQAAQKKLDQIRSGHESLVSLGFFPLEYAIGGGVEPGEMVIMAARPSHGKSAVALQCCHKWTAERIPSLFVSEEMSAMALGKRAIQYASDVEQNDWHGKIDAVQGDLHDFFSERENCYIAEDCGHIDAVCEVIEHHVKEKGVRCVVVDYAQLIRGEGRSMYEQSTNVCKRLKAIGKSLNIVLVVLAQLSRNIENRDKFQPKPSDLKETGQFEQDGDVILGLVWPHRVDKKQPPKDYKFYVMKNKNRETSRYVVDAQFHPMFQRFAEVPPPQFNEFSQYAE